MKIKAGLDIGNGYIKGLAEDMDTKMQIKIDAPTCTGTLTSEIGLPTKESEIPEVMDDIFNNMDLTFDSKLVKGTSRRLFGQRAIRAGLILEMFDVNSHTSKCLQDLNAVEVLGSLAGVALKNYYSVNGRIPKEDETLQVTVRVALSLPIREYKKHRESYAASLKSTTHYVTFHNFETRVRVELKFEDVQVLAEGASAQFAIMSKGEDFINALLDDVKRMDPTFDTSITASDIASATNVIGIDIGEGTVNFPVFTNGTFNADASITFDKGYGTVLDSAVARLQDEDYPLQTRKHLADYLQTKPTAMKRNQYNRAKAVLDEEISVFVKELKLHFSKVMSKVGMLTEVVYVYGGGATPVKEALYPLLIETGKEYGGGYPMMYLDSSYSRNLNREGLFYIVTATADAATTKPAKASK